MEIFYFLPFLVTFSFVGLCNGQGCNIYHEFTAASPQSVYLQSPAYPSSYPPNTDCTYTIASPAGTKISMNCNDFNLESSQNCVYDNFLVSVSGDSQFRDREFFCGKGSFSRQSVANRLTVSFHSDDSNPQSNTPYRFQCTLSVIPSSSCSCGVSNPQMASKIVGGTDAVLGEFPWRVALYSQSLGVFCAGSIISPNYVLTAAHCTASVQPGDTIYVNAGDLDLSRGDEANNQLVPVDYWVQNSLYDPQTQDADVSLLKLRTPLTFGPTVGPVCLPWKYAAVDWSGQKAMASGWGTQYFGGGISPVLKKVDLPLLESAPCSRYYVGSSITVNARMICTYSPGKDTCQGDSGGSVDYKDANNGRYYAVGVTSQGISCGQNNQPGVYARVSSFLQWIQGNTGEEFCMS